MQKDGYKIIRSSMGVFAGILDPKSTETEKIIREARRLWYWDGAASLSQLAMEGVKNPDNCKFSVPVNQTTLTSPYTGFEILEVTDKARESIGSVKVWTR